MTDDEPLRLEEAASRYGVTAVSLRAERDRGFLKTFKVGRVEYTNLLYLREMEEEKCRVAQAGRGSGWTRPDSHGPSETERASSARAAALMTAEALKNNSRPTSPENSSRRLRTIP